MTTQLPWYIARAAGLVSWSMLALATLWGLALSTKVLGRRPRPNWILDIHRMLGGLALIFTGVHVAALLLDSYVGFGVADVLVPFAAKWHPVAVAWGVVGLYLLLAVELTSLARAHLPRKIWRNTHYASFPLFVTATMHGLTAGTDARLLATLLVAATVAAAFLALTAKRVMAAGTRVPVRAPRNGVLSELRGQASVDGHDGAVHIGARGQHEVQHHVRDLFGRAVAPKRDATPGETFLGVVGDRRGHRGVDRARTHAIDGDALRTELARE
jgi:hypothetical protein